MQDILGIPGNRIVFDRLLRLLQQGSAIAFVGAGASWPLYPLWNQLIEILAQEPVQHGLATSTDEQYWIRLSASKPVHAVSRIRDRLGDSLYRTFLFETFKDRNGEGGRSYTPIHAALLRANFKAYLTTNYDPGLLEARRLTRPEIPNTGFTVWNQNFMINRWASGDVFQSEPSCPILFAHGHFSDPEHIVLDHASYRHAYHNTPYRRLFEDLWHQAHLVFVGFSFNDVVLSQISDEVLWQTARQDGGEPRHIAILGVPKEGPYTEEMRKELLDAYNAYSLFYPVGSTSGGQQDHSALQRLLDAISNLIPPEVPASATRRTSHIVRQRAVPILFAHETTEDEKFTGRKDALERLNRWAAEPAVRLIAITALGGVGKTAIVSRWLRQDAARIAECEGVFFWSFYRERDLSVFFEQLLNFARTQLGWDDQRNWERFGWDADPDEERRRKRPPYKLASDLVQSRKLLIVLDGLEVLQEMPGTVAYGKLLDVHLAELLHNNSLSESGSLIILTSRFPFPDLTPYLGSALRSLPLTGLEPEDGDALLVALGLRGQPADRKEISRRLFGHPLALRIFSRSMPPTLRSDPTRLWDMIFDDPKVAAHGSLQAKMNRLLAFYETCLPETHRQALSLVALFRAPVTEAALLPLWEKLLKQSDEDTGRSLQRALNDLTGQHLLAADLTKEGHTCYSCHPILRDHFRSLVLRETGFARQAANLLATPDTRQALSLQTLQLLATAVEMLLNAGELSAADDIFRSRLEDGYAFTKFPAPHLGLEVVRGFIHDTVRQHAVAQRLGLRSLAFYLSCAGQCASGAGEPETALKYYAESIATDPRWTDAELTYRNLGAAEVTLGQLSLASEHFLEALWRLAMSGLEQEHPDTLSWAAYVSCLRGDLPHAEADFLQADRLVSAVRSGKTKFHTRLTIRWAEHLLRTGSTVRARELIEENRARCSRDGSEDDLAYCEWILAWLDALAENWSDSRDHLERAKLTFTSGHMIHELGRVFITQAGCLLGQAQWQPALASCERAIQLAAPRSYRLIQADALCLRARILLRGSKPEPSKAYDDAEAALHLGEFCEYAWAQRDAFDLLAVACRSLGKEAESATYVQRADEWNHRLKLHRD